MENEEEVISVDDYDMEEVSAIPQRLQGQIKIQTLGRTTVGDIMLPQEKELEKIRSIAAAMEKELGQHLEDEQSGTAQTNVKKTKKKGKSQQEKKNKRGNENQDKETEEEKIVENGEKVFLSSRIGKQHYYDVIEEMQYIKGMLPTMLMTMMDWVLSCEINTNKSRNINGTVIRIIRECLIKLYCTFEEIQRQKKGTKKATLKK